MLSSIHPVASTVNATPHNLLTDEGQVDCAKLITDNKAVITEQPDYLVVNGKVTCNQAASDLLKAFNELERQKGLLSESCGGAGILQALVSMPTLQSFSLTVNAEHEYNDEGETYMCTNGNVGEVVSSGDLVEAKIKLEKLFDNADAYSDIYYALADSHECASFDIKVERSKVAHLLESGNLSGTEAFKIFLSEEARDSHRTTYGSPIQHTT